MQVTGGDPRRLPEVTTLTVDAASGGQQRDVRDLRDEHERGRVAETAVLYRDDGLYLSYVKVTTDLGGGVRDVREWALEPAELLVTTGAEPGYSRTFVMRNSDTTAELTVELLDREPITINGQAIDTVVTRIHLELSGAIEGTQTTTSWMRPSDLLAVQEQLHSDVRNGPLRVLVDYKAILENLEPVS